MFDLVTKKNQNLFIHGRVDDVINIRGHRIGSEEIGPLPLKLKKFLNVVRFQLMMISRGILFIICSFKRKNLDENICKNIISNFGSFALPKNLLHQ